MVAIKQAVSQAISENDRGAGTRQFGHLNVRERVIDTGDRAISIANISTISVATSITKGRRNVYFIGAGVVGLIGAVLVVQALQRFGPPMALGLIVLFIAGLFVLAGIRAKDKAMSFLTIVTNDGARTIFPSSNIKYLRNVKDFIGEKINRDDQTSVQYFDNRSTNVQAETANIGTDQSIHAAALVVGDNNMLASQSPGAVVGGSSYSAVNSPGAQLGTGHSSAHNRIRMEVVDFSSVLPQIAEMRAFYGRTDGTQHIEQRLIELEHLMKAGAPAPADKQRLRGLTSDLSSLLQAYPPVVQLFQHIAHLVGG